MNSYLKQKFKNDGIRTIKESILDYRVEEVFKEWVMYSGVNNCVLIGGVAVSYYLRVRNTNDIDFIFLSEEDIPTNVYKFRKVRKHGFRHIKTHVEVEVLTPETINISQELFEKVYQTANLSDGVKVASPVGLIALKLNRLSYMDINDIIELTKYCYENNIKINLHDYKVDSEKIKKYYELIKDISKVDENTQNFFVLENKQSIEKNQYKKVADIGNIDILLIDDGENSIPCFYLFKKEGANFDFSLPQYSISLNNIVLNGKLNVIDSSTGYKSFTGNQEIEEALIKWLSLDGNTNLLINEWQIFNKRKLKMKKQKNYISNYQTFKESLQSEFDLQLKKFDLNSILKSVNANEISLSKIFGEYASDDLETFCNNVDFIKSITKENLKKSEITDSSDFSTYFNTPFLFLFLYNYDDSELEEPKYLMIQTTNPKEIKMYELGADSNLFFDKLTNRVLEIIDGDKKWLYKSDNSGETWYLKNTKPNDVFKSVLFKDDIVSLIQSKNLNYSIF